MLGGKELEEAGVAETLRAIAKWEGNMPSMPEKRGLGDIVRQSDGTFDD